MPTNEYRDELRRIKAIQITTTLHKKPDELARQKIAGYQKDLAWEPLESLMIQPDVWNLMVERFDPKFVFCHPDILVTHPTTSLYYRGLSGLSQKAAKDYSGGVEGAEVGTSKIK